MNNLFNRMEMFSKWIVYANLAIFVLTLWAFPAYRNMHPSQFGNTLDVIRQSTFLIDIIAALLIFRLHWKVMLSILFVTSTTMFVIPFFDPSQGNEERSLLLTLIFFVVCYFDVTVFVILHRHQKKKL